jgi:hypothetical protein
MFACVNTNRTVKCKSLEFIIRSIARLKPTLLQYFTSNRNIGNIKPLWLICDFMLLLSWTIKYKDFFFNFEKYA